MACKLEYLGREMAFLSANTMISHVSGESNASAVGGSMCRFMTEEDDDKEEGDDDDDEGEYSSSSAAVTTRAVA
jgi:hypothetical protein